MSPKPTPEEIFNCSDYMDREWKLLEHKRVLLALGKIGWDGILSIAARQGIPISPRPVFGHGAVVKYSPKLSLVGSYHVSQQNTFTGKLTADMFDQILQTCLRLSE